VTGEPRPPVRRWGAAQSATLELAVVPYGFTLSLGGSLAVAVGRHGRPSVLDAVLLVVGAVAGFTLLSGVARYAELGRPPRPRRPTGFPWWMGPATAAAAGAAVCASWLAGGAVSGTPSWTATGLAATLVYFGLIGLAELALRFNVSGGDHRTG
jgi:hypothetical protein